MRALKGLLIYIGIVLAIILGIGVLIFGIMYFVPSFRIAGVGVIHTTNSDSGKITAMDEYSGYSDIELNISSKKIGVKIEANEQGGNVICRGYMQEPCWSYEQGTNNHRGHSRKRGLLLRGICKHGECPFP